MTDKQINKWLRRRFSPIGWLLLGFYGLMTLLTWLTVCTDMTKQALWSFAAGDFSGSVDWNRINGNAWGYIVSILVGFAILQAWKGRDYRKLKLYAGQVPMKAGTLLCFLVFCMGAQMINSLWITFLELLLALFGKSILPVLEMVAGSSDTFSMFFYASILAPLWEELVFRGYILRTLQPYGKRFAILGSALLFGLFHGNLLQTPYAVFMGLLLGYVAVEYSIRWSVLLHMFNNLVLADLLTRVTAGWSEMAYSILSLILFGGGFLVSLTILIRNRDRIRAYRKEEWMDRRCLKCFFTNAGILAFAAVMTVSMITMFLA